MRNSSGVPARRLPRFGIDPCRGTTRVQRAQNIGLIGGEEQIRLQSVQVVVRRATARKDAPLDREARELRRAEDPQPGYRIVLGEDHHLDALGAQRIERQQLLHQRKGDPFARRHLQPRILQRDVSGFAFALEHLVFFFEVKQRARGNRHDQLAFDRIRHGAL